MLVMKFGGSSLADAEAINRACSIIGRRTVRASLVVVSAFGNTTDRLLEAAETDPGASTLLLGELQVETMEIASSLVRRADSLEATAFIAQVFREAETLIQGIRTDPAKRAPSAALDALLACGERISSRVIALALRAHRVDAHHLDARQCFVTEERHGGAQPLFDETREKLLPAVTASCSRGRVPVLGGFIASSQSGLPTNLGRGGSDLTATIAGAALEAEEVQIWTDVDGVMTADPSLIESARSLPVLSLSEASELAYFGARVLHPSTMLPAIEHGVPVRVLNARKPDSTGTLIAAEPPQSQQVVKSIAYKEGITLVDIHSTRMLMAHGFLASIFEIFDRHETAVDMVSTSEVSVSLTVDRPDRLEAIVRQVEKFATVSTAPRKAIVCVVGEGIRYTPGIAAKVFNAMDGIRIRMISLGASRVNVGFVVDQADLESAVRRLHATFFPEPAPDAERQP